MLLRTWKSMLTASFRRRRSPRRRVKSNPYRSCAEILEDRVLLTVSAGSLDPSFGIDGMVSTTDFEGRQFGGTSDLIRLSDGSMIVGGFADSSGIPNGQDFALAKFTADGEIVTSFGDSGIVRTDLGDDETVRALAVDDSGRIIAAGGNQNLAIARYLPDGSLDQTFGNGGLVVTDVSQSFERVESIAIVEHDGTYRIIVAADFVDQLLLAQFNADGSLDESFGVAGIVLEDLGGDARAQAMVADSFGRIITVGQFEDQTTFDDDFLVVRHNADGSLDGNFGDGGIIRTSFGESFERAQSVALDHGEGSYKIVVGGQIGFGSSSGALVRYEFDGSLDETFGIGGKVSGLDTGSIRDLVVDDASQVFVAGSGVLARFDATGTLDPNFGENGSIAGGAVFLGDIAVDDAGRISVAGNTEQATFGLTRFTANGVLDEDFGNDGVAFASVIGPVSAGSRGMELIQADGKILALAAGTQLAGFVVLRYNADGTLDESFGEAGRVQIDQDVSANSFLVDSAGRIVVFGTSRDGARRLAAIRLLADGSRDSSFGQDGVQMTDVAAFPIGIAQDGQGRLVISGNAIAGGTALVRLTDEGSLDEAFGTNGVAISDVSFAFPHDISVDSNNRILILDRFAGVARFLENGSLDTDFGQSGIAPIPSTSIQNRVITVDPEGRVLVGGLFSSNRFAVYRLDESGSLVPFPGGNFALASVAAGVAPADLLVDGKGRLVAVGSDAAGIQEFAVVRWDANGVLDSSFGVAKSSFGDFAFATSAAIDAQGNIVVSGSIRGGIGLARFIGDAPIIEKVDLGTDLHSITIQLNDDDLQAALAEDTSNFRLTIANGDANGDGDFFNDGDETDAAIGNVIYDPALDQIRLELVDAVFADVYRLEIDGDYATSDGSPGLVNENGISLQGGDFQRDFDLRVLTLVEALLDKVESLGLSTSADQSLTGRLAAATKVLGAEVDSDDGLVNILESFRLGVEGWFDRGEITEADRDDLFADVDLILLGLALV